MILQQPFTPCPVFSCLSFAGKVHPCQLLFCLSLSACVYQFPLNIPCRIVFARPEDLAILPNHLSFHLLSMTRPRGYKTFSMLNSTQLSMNFFLLINVKMPTIVGILTFWSRKNSIIGLSEPKKAEILDIFYTYEHLKFRAQLS